MAGRAQHSNDAPHAPVIEGARVLLIEAPYYASIAKALAAGAIEELTAAGAIYERVQVPGALEIPLLLGQAVQAGLIPASAGNASFDGCVALGCIIRGETTHYETVCDNANHWLMDLAVRHAIPLGNAILTVENEAQAMARAEGGRRGKGADAVRACLALIAHARAFEERRAD
ncbi:MAG TPA: 6,7-dimethyl-8-ribityllumazine synthase [Hyphomicrobiaceae bacterium]|nr:6,7-dimethyl-8-ribityllumazine synthase [Hyphomicrobiaceae bacterium]